jgi:hypothetical protein
MNYQRIYNQIIKRGQNRVPEEGKYYETHHILPKCMGGLNNPENLVKLEAREHFLCHWLLCRIYPEDYNLSYAFWSMCNTKGRGKIKYIISSRIYEEAKKNLNLLKFSIEHKEKISLNKLILSKEQVEEVINLLQTTKLTLKEIGNKFNINDQIIFRIKSNNSFYNKYFKLYYKENLNKLRELQLTKKQVKNIIELLKKNKLTFKEISEIYKVDEGIIYSIISNKSPYNKKYNLYFKEDLNHPCGYKLSKKEVEKIIFLLKEKKLKQIEIDKLFNVSGLTSCIKNNKSCYNRIYNLYYENRIISSPSFI